MSVHGRSLGVVLFEVASYGKPFNSKELLAYRNSSEAAFANSFWPFLCRAPSRNTKAILLHFERSSILFIFHCII